MGIHMRKFACGHRGRWSRGGEEPVGEQVSTVGAGSYDMVSGFQIKGDMCPGSHCELISYSNLWSHRI